MYFGLRETKGNTHKHEENTQTPHRKVPVRLSVIMFGLFLLRGNSLTTDQTNGIQGAETVFVGVVGKSIHIYMK